MREIIGNNLPIVVCLAMAVVFFIIAAILPRGGKL